MKRVLATVTMLALMLAAGFAMYVEPVLAGTHAP